MDSIKLLVMFIIGAIIVVIFTVAIMKINFSARSGTSFLTYCGNYELNDFSSLISSKMDSDVNKARLFYSKEYRNCFPPNKLKISTEKRTKLFCCPYKEDLSCGSFTSKFVEKACNFD